LLLPLTRLVSRPRPQAGDPDTRYLMFQNNSKFSLLSFSLSVFQQRLFP